VARRSHQHVFARRLGAGAAFADELQKLHPAEVLAVLGNPYPAVSIASLSHISKDI
jgi:hypothetical protein